MYKVIIRFHEGRTEIFLGRMIDLPSLDLLKVTAVGFSLRVTVFNEDGSVKEEFCGPDIQYHVYRVQQPQ